MNTKVISTAVLTLSLGALAACGTSAKTSQTSHAQSSQGGTVVVALPPQATPNWYFPVINAPDYTTQNLQIQFLMYRPLVYFNKNSQIDYSQSLAQKVTANAAGTQFTVNLGHDNWSNGQPVTAQDVVFTVDLMLGASKPNSPWVYGDEDSGGEPSDWKSVTAPNSHTVVFTLQKPANLDWFIENGLSQIIPVPKAVWNRYPHNMTQELKFIESVGNSPRSKYYDVVDGPFKFQGFEANNYWAFVPNQKFSGHKASISKLVLQYEASDSAEFTALKDGTVSVGYLPFGMMKSKGELTNDAFSSSYLLADNFIVPNLNPQAPGGMGKVLSHLYVRQALQMGIDQSGIIKTLYDGYGVPTDGPLPPKPLTPYYDAALKQNPYPFNPAAGKKLLESHGWKDVHGVMTKDGQKLNMTLLYTSGDTYIQDTVELIKSDLAREGIQVSLDSQPLNQVFATLSQADPAKWQLGYWGTGLEYQYNYYPSGDSLFNTGGVYNLSGYNSHTANQLINATELPGTPAQTKARMNAYQEYLAHQLPVLWMPWFPSGYSRVSGLAVHAKNVHGTVATYNPVTNMMEANYWTVSH